MLKIAKTIASISLLLLIFQCQQNQEEKKINFESPLKIQLELMADSLSRAIKPWNVPNRIFAVEDYGATGDSTTVNTEAIQSAIDACSANGGGTVLFNNGNYVTGTITLKSGVMLEVKKGSRILGSTDLLDYPNKVEAYKSLITEDFYYDQCLIYAEKADRVGIKGEGEINFRGNKKYFPGPQTITSIEDRPFGIRMIQCTNVVLQDITLKNAAAWMQHYLLCDTLLFEGIKVYNHANVNNDGLDLDASKNVVVRNCYIDSEDDAFCMKGIGNQTTQNILVENCTFLSKANAFKIGTDTQGSFRRIIARNLTLGGIKEGDSLLEVSTGITLATVDGGDVEDIYIHDITISQARCPIFLRLGDRGRVMDSLPKPAPGNLRRILIENVKGKDNFSQGSFISGISSKQIEDVTIRNVSIEMAGGGTMEFAGQTVVEDDARYPDAHRFHKWGLPAYGFYIRHAKNIRLDSVSVSTLKSDARPEVVAKVNTHNVTYNNESIK